MRRRSDLFSLHGNAWRANARDIAAMLRRGLIN
jgi:hypothetical protein